MEVITCFKHHSCHVKRIFIVDMVCRLEVAKLNITGYFFAISIKSMMEVKHIVDTMTKYTNDIRRVSITIMCVIYV